MTMYQQSEASVRNFQRTAGMILRTSINAEKAKTDIAKVACKTFGAEGIIEVEWFNRTSKRRGKLKLNDRVITF